MSDTSQGDHEYFRKRGFGGEMGFGDRPALLVIDIMNAFTNPGMPLGADLSLQIEHINTLLDAAEAAKTPAFFSVVSYEEADCRDAGIWGNKMSGLFDLKTGSEAVELDPRLHMPREASVLNKKYASCFFGTDLVSRLQSWRVDTLIITGCTTSGCVRASTVDAVQYGFRPIVVEEAVGDRAQLAHRQALFDIQAKYGDVRSIEDTVARLAQVAAAAG